MSFKNKNNEMLSLEISDNQDTDATEKKSDFKVEFSSTGTVFLIEIFLEEIEFVVAQLKV